VGSEGNSCESANHRRTKLGGIDDPEIRRLEIEQQHLGNEIHAVPSLLAEIGHDGDTRQRHATRCRPSSDAREVDADLDKAEP
jgi:hypothetical protein